eukprot:CAMPEP_0175842108 /NCGR_PEP_ID=MMETSP0107_2-20121207/20309_1 /TAXON_ID=195067 ORGANISM="Goniomonas pacifica, Strain CCMP1869" /NCGR_SAMPLE_ID=MMETSP0107_2 /ASSEMBLY_ACC=CAM_ASM_000203 /LENGTH=238 /DNA_ID=CAMNT_0017156165 /DNA_START=73 /DNA_END=790 /DNA_ORIENTATION=+
MASTTVLLAPILMGTPPRIDTSDDTPLLTFAIGGGIVAFLALGGVSCHASQEASEVVSPKAETATARSSVEPETPVKSRTKNSWMIPSPFARSSARSSSETKKKGAPKGTPARSVQTPQSAPPKYRGRAAIPMSPCGTIPLAPLRVTPPPLILSDENHVAVRLEPLSPFRKTPTHKPHSPGISRVASLTPKGAFHLAKLSPNLTESPMSQSPTRSPTRDGEAWSPSPDAPGSPDTQRG